MVITIGPLPVLKCLRGKDIKNSAVYTLVPQKVNKPIFED